MCAQTQAFTCNLHRDNHGENNKKQMVAGVESLRHLPTISPRGIEVERTRKALFHGLTGSVLQLALLAY